MLENRLRMIGGGVVAEKSTEATALGSGRWEGGIRKRRLTVAAEVGEEAVGGGGGGEECVTEVRGRRKSGVDDAEAGRVSWTPPYP